MKTVLSILIGVKVKWLGILPKILITSNPERNRKFISILAARLLRVEVTDVWTHEKPNIILPARDWVDQIKKPV
jgi:hypothetical protein